MTKYYINNYTNRVCKIVSKFDKEELYVYYHPDGSGVGTPYVSFILDFFGWYKQHKHYNADALTPITKEEAFIRIL